MKPLLIKKSIDFLWHLGRFDESQSVHCILVVKINNEFVWLLLRRTRKRFVETTGLGSINLLRRFLIYIFFESGSEAGPSSD